MATITQTINNIIEHRNTIHTKVTGTDRGTQFGLTGVDNNIEAVASAVDGIQVYDLGTLTIGENQSKERPAGYYHAFTVASGSASDNYKTQSKTVTLTEDILSNGFTVDNDPRYFALDTVVINAASDFLKYKQTTATAANVLADTQFVTASNVVTEGTMPNNGAVNASIDTKTASYTIPAGYHNGSGKVSLVTETKSVTPTKSPQEVTPSSGKVLSKVDVAAIPAAYQDVTAVDAVASDVLAGNTFVDASGKVIEGSMADLGSASATLTTIFTSKTFNTGYTSGGAVTVSSQDDKVVTPTTSQQTVKGDNNAFLTQVVVEAIPNQKSKVNASINGTTVTEVTIPAGYYVESGKVTFDDSAILNLLQQI